jgi:hypothetical protein
MSNEIVKPVEVNGIEFYVSKGGKTCGISQNSLAALSGQSVRNISRLLTEIGRLKGWQESSGIHEEPTVSAAIQVAALTVGNGFVDRQILDFPAFNQAKVINSKLVARIIRYYAYQAPKRSETAAFSYDKFAEIGIDSWIKEVTNFAEASDMYSLMESMNSTLLQLNTKVDEMSVQLSQTEGYRSARLSMSGLRTWMESISTEEFNQIALPASAAEDLFTLTEWAEMSQNGVVLSKSNKHALANIVSSTYKLMELELPKKVVRLNEKGYKLPPVQAYPRRHFVLINMCYTKLVSAS